MPENDLPANDISDRFAREGRVWLRGAMGEADLAPFDNLHDLGARPGVPWHQDRVVAMREHHEVDGFSNWSCKGGVWHCEPPQVVLNEMLFVRVHLDDAEGESGNMEIALNG